MIHYCKRCQKQFNGRSNRVYCSLSCKSKDQDRSKVEQYDRRQHRNPNWKGNDMLKICPNCNKEYRAKRITQTYCNKNCWREHLSQEFKNGRAAKQNALITNPSKPQLELFEMVRQVYPDCILNYPTKSNFSIDIAIENKMIAIEYDGSYWHNEQYDKKRQHILEQEGWSFLRYVDRVPSFDELVKDIKGI